MEISPAFYAPFYRITLVGILLFLLIGIVIIIVAIVMRKRTGSTVRKVTEYRPIDQSNKRFSGQILPAPFLDKKENADEIGARGEKIAFFHSIPIYGYGKQVRNIYLPLSNGRTTEVDVVLIHTNGIFVIESKNYRGWIFGKDTDKNWTVTYSKSKRYTFYNPIMQNAAHVKKICELTGISPDKVFSVVVFARESELKKIVNQQPNTFVIRYTGLGNKLKLTMERNGEILDFQTVNRIYEQLKVYENADDETKNAHIQFVKGLSLKDKNNREDILI
ncbi:nuclease-related domain-containing protein [Oscillospiraceae bacterium MB08-C2-2]|nr:nuclease-related domain-containing protein [Oscillospiraceae bacterium MB08-C2-2]